MITYRTNYPLDPLDVVRIFDNSGIRRPTTDLPRIARMFAAPCLVLSAWEDETLIGLSRSLTDFAYCCYLSDLAVDRNYQKHGIGRELVRRTQAVIGDGIVASSSASRSAIPRSFWSCSPDRSNTVTCAPAAASTGACWPPAEARQRIRRPRTSPSQS
jgi:GNAT superfamily N-acetyltransferase